MSETGVLRPWILHSWTFQLSSNRKMILRGCCFGHVLHEVNLIEHLFVCVLVPETLTLSVTRDKTPSTPGRPLHLSTYSLTMLLFAMAQTSSPLLHSVPRHISNTILCNVVDLHSLGERGRERERERGFFRGLEEAELWHRAWH